MDENNERQTPQSEYDIENAVEQNNNTEETAEESSGDVQKEIPMKYHSEKNSKEISRLQSELKKAIEERDSVIDKYQRTFSEYNNYKKRNQALASQAMTAGACDAVEKILPVLDNLERALEHVNSENEDAVAKGVSMVHKQLAGIIDGMGVKEIPALGMEFDPNLHHAIQEVETKDGEQPGTVSAVAQKGYMLGDKILRHSMVIVNK
jgi:molecular chaperone GrpE